MTPTALQSYSDALDYLQSFINWEVARHMRYTPDVMTLARPRAILAALGDPHRRYPVVHIAGTKGKGSVGAMTAAALTASGLRTGLYSSPHLQDYRERFRVDGDLITREDFIAAVNRLRPVADQIPGITWFEVTTALALMYFAERAVDVAVIEVGLGGRLDATNVVMPVTSVITSLSYDHTHLLGDSLTSIAREKGGIIKQGVPVVSAPQSPEALAVLAEIAQQNEAPLSLVGRDWLYDPCSGDLEGEYFRAGPAGAPLEPYRTNLIGEHQALNATVALAVLDRLRAAGMAINGDDIRVGLARVDWPGRLEVIHRDPLVVLDAAHNASSARRLRAALSDRFPQRRLGLIFGASSDKDIAGMFDELLPVVDVLFATQAAHPRALAPGAIASLARERGYDGPLYEALDIRTALRQAADQVGADGMICATGSLFIVGEARSAFNLPVGHVALLPSKRLPQSLVRRYSL